MEKRKLLYKITCVFVLLCTLIITTVCIVFSNQGNDNNDNSTDTNPSASLLDFDYSDKISLFYGDDFNLAPEKTDTPLIYSSADTSILTVSQDGKVDTISCGTTEVNIRKGVEIVKTVTISISLNVTIENTYNCEFENNNFALSNNIASFNLSISNSKGEEVAKNTKINTSTSKDIVCTMKLYSFVIEADNSGDITLEFPELNYEIIYSITI